MFGTGRLETFSDGVIAIIITIMVLELKVPSGADLSALREALPTFLAYILSFSILGIYWNNHHHLLRAAKSLSPSIMWANLHFLFWLSLIPFVTTWLGQNYHSSIPTALYAILMLCCGTASALLQTSIVKHNGKNSQMAINLGNDLKGKLSLVMYVLALVLAFVNPLFSDILFALVAITWFIPDKRWNSKDEV